ncbi:bifunctional DNA-formamidopyrimidine glycosylase/DNA-(apurinic or apyrimidinic site) lyase [Pseudokineococcus basanitobsidens]|uniref:Formamidopyrimidine-DNA glycosylase n=1 Tax=Pseudokineococcus basanitobsidens TaxID=1926649 RepID=A0ABU8RJY9_9ACTN
MPELPEVEVVRRGLDAHVVGRTVTDVAVLHPRPVRRHVAGPLDFAGRLAGTRVDAAVRRGKYLWLQLDSGDALSAHLGMSGQMLVEPPDAEPERHLRVRLDLSDGRQLRFVDQRMFGGLVVVGLVPTPDGLPAGTCAAGESDPLLPPEVAHVARDPLDPHLDAGALVERFRRRRTGVKRALLDQTLLSGVGNIYADEALWRSRLHFARPTDTMTRPAVRRLVDDVADVMRAALVQGGTSFDALYVNVNGASGYFDRSLAVYGQEGEPCPRCGAAVTREAFMNRSSYRCPRCQPVPRNARW